MLHLSPDECLDPSFPDLSDLIQAALIVCGISTAIQVTGLRFGPIYWGSGILSVMGVSFTSVGIWTSSIGTMMVSRDWSDPSIAVCFC